MPEDVESFFNQKPKELTNKKDPDANKFERGSDEISEENEAHDNKYHAYRDIHGQEATEYYDAKADKRYIYPRDSEYDRFDDYNHRSPRLHYSTADRYEAHQMENDENDELYW